MKSLIKKSFTALSLMMAAAGAVNAQTMVDMSLTGSPSEGGDYPGFIHAATFDAIFFPGVVTNLPVGSIMLTFSIPPGAEFDATYTGIPAGWQYSVVDAQNINLTNTNQVSSGAPVIFNIPFKVVAGITPTPTLSSPNATGQIQITSMFIDDGSVANNTFSTTIKVINTPLPLQFVAFEAKENNCKSDLTWTTVGEKNNNYFEIERSTDGEHFATVGRVKSAGNNVDENEYSYVDETPAKGHNFYRIRQVDMDGKSTTSAIKQVRFECAVDAIELYPNPTTGIIYVKGLKDKTTIEVMNMVGQKVMSKETQNSLEGVNLSSLAEGAYQVNVVNSAKQIIFTAKVVKK